MNKFFSFCTVLALVGVALSAPRGSLEEEFQKADTNRNNKLELQEFRSGLPDLKSMPNNIFNSQILPLFQANDLNKDNALDLSETKSLTGDIFWMNLLTADANRDGMISLSEFKQFDAASGQQAAPAGQIAQLFKLADTNNNNVIERAEGKLIINFL